MPDIRLPADHPPAILRRWYRPVGARVEAGEVILEIETDDDLVHVEAPRAGRLADRLAEPGSRVTPGALLAHLTDPQETDPVTESTPAGPAPSAPDDVVPILLPQAGNSMEEGTIISWRVAEGDRVEPGDVLYEMETDKATVEVEADQGGRVARIFHDEGATVPVKQCVALLAEEGADVDAWIADNAPAGASPCGGGLHQSADSPASPAGPSASGSPDHPAATASPSGEVAVLRMPQAGNTMEEGTIVDWKVAIGDRIESGQVVVEVETDKATVEVEADQAGRLARIVAQAGDVVPVKGPIAYLAASDADVDAYLAAGGDAPAGATASGGPTSGSYDTTPGRAATPSRGSQADRPAVSQVSGAASGVATAPSAGGRVKASPAARQVARKRGIDLATVGAGSGPGGRVLSTDVLSAASAAPAGPVRRPMTKMRRAIARNLQASKQTVPHFYMRLTVDAEPLQARYRQAKAQFPCSLNDLLTQAVARTVREFPAFRSRIEGEDVVEWPSANIGIAVGTDEGLTVPVLVGADRMDLPKLAAETRRVVDAARNGQLEGLGQGVFTISNLGMFGVEEFSAIINPPESAILAVGAIREEVVVENGAMRPGKVMTMTLSCDHRVVDGVAAAKFVGRLREMLTAREDRE